MPHARTIILLAVVLCGASMAHAQTGQVTGTVRDDRGFALPGVNVVVDGTTLGAASDVDGRYVISRLNEGPVSLTASAIGYGRQRREITIRAGRTAVVDFVLEETILDGMEVIVTASRREQAAVDAPASVAVISPRALARRNVVALDDALRYVPGVNVQENQVNIRGSSGFAYNTGSRVLLLLDGMPLLTADTDGMPFDALPIARIERIEVLKGPGSALYGGGALGGVINVITKDVGDAPETHVIGFVGAHDPVRYDEWTSAWPEGADIRPFGGVNLSHARRFSPKTGGWINLAVRQDPGYLNFHEAFFAQAFAKLEWQPSPSFQTSLLLGGLARKRDNFLFWNGARDALNPGSIAIGRPSENGDPTGTNDVLTNQVSVLPAITHFLSPKVFYSARGRVFGTLIRPIDNETGKVKRIKDGTIGVRYGGEIQLAAEPTDGRYLTVGVSGDALATQSTFFVTADGDSTRGQPETAAFAQWDEKIGPVTVSAGLRFDRYEIDSGTTVKRASPKLALSWRLAGRTAVRLAYGHGFRVPSIAERFTDDRDFFPIVRNLSLKPERNESWEAGIRTTISALDGRIEVDAAVFQSDYFDLIEPRLVPEVRAFQFVNLTRARIRGGEISVDFSNDYVDTKVGYTLLDADDLTVDDALASRSRHQLTTGFDIEPFRGIEFGADLRLMSAPERVDTDFALFVADADRLVGMRVVDVRASWGTESFRIAALVANIFDYYYLERPAFLAPPRHFQIRVEYGF